MVRWLWGYRKVGCEKFHSVRLLNLMMQKEISHWGLERENGGDITFFLLEKDYKKLLCVLDKNAIKVYSVYGKGLPFVCRSHRNRFGLLVGLGIYFIIIFLSSLFVWDIRVVSDTVTPHNVIISNLKELGCYEGSFLPSIDFEDLCIRYLSTYKDFSWVSVNVRGTIAYVEIQEKKFYEEESETPRNLIASYGGIIEDYCVFSGRSHVSPGAVVKKGDLLISGIVDDVQGSIRLCRARGEVMAVVDSELSVEVPYSYQKQVYTGEIYEKNRIRFFNLTFPLVCTEPKEASRCTHSYESGSMVLFEVIELPLSIEKEVWREYTVEDFVYTQEEAETVALRKMEEKYRSELPDAELITIDTVGEHTEDRYILTCKIKCRMDIVQEAEIYT